MRQPVHDRDERVEPRRREDEAAEHRTVGSVAVPRIARDRRLQVERGRREEPRVVDESLEERRDRGGDRHASPGPCRWTGSAAFRTRMLIASTAIAKAIAT